MEELFEDFEFNESTDYDIKKNKWDAITKWLFRIYAQA